jgi:hypothetical protein
VIDGAPHTSELFWKKQPDNILIGGALPPRHRILPLNITLEITRIITIDRNHWSSIPRFFL